MGGIYPNPTLSPHSEFKFSMSKSLDADLERDLEISQGIMGVPYNKLMNMNNVMDTNVVSIIIFIVKNDFSHGCK